MRDLKYYYELVEKVIADLGVDVSSTRGDQEGQWNLQKGNVPVWVDVFYDDNNKSSYIQVMAPITEIPLTNKDTFYEEVLDLSHDLFGVGFTKYENHIYLKSIREIEGLDESEFRATMNRIGTYSEEYEAHFKKYFGGKAPDDEK
jgi:hypothetical protein